ncbi:MarR family winged helix-turn-helix transcriptional regulator [Kineosporia sp. A_224]|uniref:MarR family winged helix-turn-helix transcriptional regulator n=1 Tax=Kineosporia sp. A_224 TaxID=1962180 RepID=UPI000B4AA2BA|nr:MarR family transcriptional regulator [Kineosporia sp. A_224]
METVVPRPGRQPGKQQCRPAGLAAELRPALMRTVRRIRAEKADADLTEAQYSVLALLDREGPQSPRALAAYERVQPPSMTRTVAALADLGLVTRSEHPDDGRQVVVALTAAGTATIRETRRRRDAWLARRLAELTPAERETLAAASEILRRIAAS